MKAVSYLCRRYTHYRRAKFVIERQLNAGVRVCHDQDTSPASSSLTSLWGRLLPTASCQQPAAESESTV